MEEISERLRLALCLHRPVTSTLGVQVYKSASQTRRGHWGAAPGNPPVFHDALQLGHDPKKHPQRTRQLKLPTVLRRNKRVSEIGWFGHADVALSSRASLPGSMRRF